MIMGLGTTLFEAVDVADGQVTNANLSDYEIPSFVDVPLALTHDLLERDGADVHGLGETALPPVPPSMGNALALARPPRHRPPDQRRGGAGRRRPACKRARGACVRIAFTVNGEGVEVDARSDEMLLEVLRRDLGLTSVRATCGIGVCGACTALVDGEPISTCLLLAPLAEGRQVTTVEGLGGRRPGPARVRRGARVPVRLLHARA